MQLLKVADPEIYATIDYLEVPTFCVSWVITWFSHSLPKYKDACRVFDFCLASHPLACCYLVVALLINNKEFFLEELEYQDLGELHMHFQSLKDICDVE